MKYFCSNVLKSINKIPLKYLSLKIIFDGIHFEIVSYSKIYQQIIEN